MADLDSRFPEVSDFEEGARKRIPRFAFEYLMHGVGRDVCSQRNRQILDNVRLRARYLVDVPEVSLETTIFGQTYDAPFGIAPFGMSGLIWPKAAEILSRAARNNKIPCGLSTFGTTALEDFFAEGGPSAWYQLYPPNDEELCNKLVDQVKEAGYQTLIITVDVPTFPRAAPDIRNGLSLPPKYSIKNALQVAMRPSWAWHSLKAGVPQFANLTRFAPDDAGVWEAAAFAGNAFSGRIPLETLQRLRDSWNGNFVIKGILDPEDAQKCLELGADGLIVSNHAGRQLDAAPTSVEVLPEICNVVGKKAVVIADGGVRSGIDVARLLALGADFVLAGRAFALSVAAAGYSGADHAISIMKNELEATCGQVGCARPSELRHHLCSTTSDQNTQRKINK